jgi:hypothetical protein
MKRVFPVSILLLSLAGRSASAQEEEAATIGEEVPAEEIGSYEVAGEVAIYEPILTFRAAGYHPETPGIELQIPFSMSERFEGVSSFPIDADGTVFSSDPALDTQLRVGATFNTNMAWAPIRIVARYEHDILTGLHSGGIEADDTLGLDLPDSGDAETVLRRASLQLDLGFYMHITAGFTMSHFGLGLIANDGAHGWEPGSAQFSDPRGGDRVVRGLMAFGPFTDGGLLIAIGGDQVQDDDALRPGDEAQQLVATVVYGYGRAAWIGAYGVIREQTAEDDTALDVRAVDLAGAYQIDLGDGAVWEISGEAAFIWGETGLSPTVDFPIHDVLQLGVALRSSIDFGDAGAVLDFLYASGDDNFDDDRLTGFKADNNYPSGLLLHRYVVAAQTSRAPITASNLELVGVPSEDLDRIPTQGAVTNTVSFFPRGWWRPVDYLEIYGGPLLAFSQTDLADPFNSRLAGGDPRNALGGDPGGYLGTELDFGVRYRRLMEGTELTIGLEGAILLPGEALATPEGGTMDSIAGGRATLDYRF